MPFRMRRIGIVMRVFIAGASGVLGRAAIRQFVNAGHSVTGFVRNQDKARLVQSLGAQPVIGDLFDPAQVRQAAQNAEAILHLATAIPTRARTKPADWEINDRLRREGTAILLSVAREVQVRAYIQQSIAFVYGDAQGKWLTEDQVPRPNSITQSALDAENLCLRAYRAEGLPVVILRGATFYSADSAQTRLLLDAIKKRGLPLIDGGKQYWHYIHVHDMARAVVMATLKPAPGEMFFVADDWPFHAGELIELLAAKLNAPPPLKMPGWVARLVARDSVAFPKNSARYKTDKIKKMLGWAPQYSTYRDGFAQVFKQLGIPF